MAKGNKNSDIDEGFILRSIKKDFPNSEKVVDEVRRIPQNNEDYKSLFIMASPTVGRLGKVSYIRKEYHDRIVRIIQTIGNNEISLYSYVDNVLKHHFDTYKDEITEIYNNSTKPIF